MIQFLHSLSEIKVIRDSRPAVNYVSRVPLEVAAQIAKRTKFGAHWFVMPLQISRLRQYYGNDLSRSAGSIGHT